MKACLPNPVSFITSFPYRYVTCLCRCPSRWWWWRRERRRALALLLWLHHALSDRLLEGPVRLRSSHRVLERLGLLLCVHPAHRHVDRRHRRPGVPLWMHHWPEGLGDGCGVCGPRDLGTWWVCAFFCWSESPAVTTNLVFRLAVALENLFHLSVLSAFSISVSFFTSSE